MTHFKRDMICGMVLLLLAVAAGWRASTITSRFPTGVDSGYFPERVAFLIGILALAILIRAWHRRHIPTPREDVPIQLGNLAMTFLALVAYAVLVPLLSFVVATLAFIGMGLVLLSPPGERRWKPFAITAVVATTLITLVFTYGFGVILPSGPF